MFVRPCEEFHRRTSLVSLSLFLNQCPACLVCLIWVVFKVGGTWPYSCCFVGFRFQVLFNIAHNILVKLLLSFFSICLVSIQVVHPYSSMDMTATRKKLQSILSDRSDFYMTDNLLIAVIAFVSRVLISFSVNEALLSRLMELVH